MNDKQFISHKWLSRCWNEETEINQLIKTRDRLLEQGVGKYDNKAASGCSDHNPNEARFIEYSYLSEQIEKKSIRLSKENVRTLELIERLNNTTYRKLLRSRYIFQLSWEAAGKEVHYGKSQAAKLGNEALEAIFPIIPKGELL